MKKTLLLAGVASIFAFNAQALDAKPYVGLDYVYSKADLATDEFDDQWNAYAVSVGTKLNKNFGVEAFYQETDDAEKSVAVPALSSVAKTEASYKAYGVDFIGYLPVDCNEKLELLGSVGLAQYDVESKIRLGVLSESSDEDGLGLRFGAGAQYNFNEHLAARAMIRYSDINVEGVDKIVDLTAGVRYTF